MLHTMCRFHPNTTHSPFWSFSSETFKIAKSDLCCKSSSSWFVMQWIPHKDVWSFTKSHLRNLYPLKDNEYLLPIQYFLLVHVGPYSFTSDRKVDTWFRTHVHWIATVIWTRFSFSSIIYISIKKFLKVHHQPL